MARPAVSTLYLLGFAWTIALFVFGEPVATLVMAHDSDPFLHDTSLETSPVALVIGAPWIALAGLHYGWRKLTATDYSETKARIGWGASFLGVNLVVIPQILIGAHGMPRRYADARPSFELYEQLTTLGLIVHALGLAIACYALVRSLLDRK